MKGRTGLELLAATCGVCVLLAVATVLHGKPVVVLDAGMVPVAAPAAPAGRLDWLIFGGGGTPADNQVAIESDMIAASKTFAGRGRVMFSAGARAPTVQVLDHESNADPLLSELGAFFQPRASRSARFRYPKMPCTACTAPTLLRAVRHQLRQDGGDLLLFAVGHGEVGAEAADNYIALWGRTRLHPRDLAGIFDRSGARRTVRLVATSCFSGGFGELVFRAADHRRGQARTSRCGLFASPWDLESSGCDADPDRRRHHGYATYFLAALRGQRRDGTSLRNEDIDFDDDGYVSLTEAHARVRIDSPTADVPTTTSERWLRFVAPPPGAVSPVSLPEEEAVIDALAEALGLSRPEETASQLFALRQKRVDAGAKRLKTVQRAEDDAYRAVEAELLARWPTIDDPWHPGFRDLLRRHRREIGDFIKASNRWHDYRRAVIVTNETSARQAALRRSRAKAERLHRAVQNLVLGRRLTARRGQDWIYWRQLLRCERHVPRLTTVRARQ